MARKKVLALIPVLSLLALQISIPTAHATGMTQGNCTVDVASTTGVVLVNSGGYCYLAFSNTGSNSFVVPSGTTSAEVLVVAGGGGGGGGAWGGGGGAGGVIYSNNYPLTQGTTMNLSVGAGGSGGGASLTPSLNRSSNGTNSWFNTSSTFVAVGGGGGAGYAYGSATASEANGNSGGNGGGGTEYGGGGTGGSSTQTSPAYLTTKYGNSGGNSAAGSGYVAGAGGGGAGAAGGAMTTSNVGGDGGAGTSAFSQWFTALGQFGVAGYIAGGGGGGSQTTAGSGGAGGGGAGGGSSSRAGANATANTGGGGGGASYDGSKYVGGNGGSGLIVIKFAEYLQPSTITSPTYSGAIYKGITKTLTVTVNAPGKVTFYASKKRIPGCIAVATTGSSPSYTATCNWKPATRSYIEVTATFTPSNIAQGIVTSQAIKPSVGKRTTTR